MNPVASWDAVDSASASAPCSYRTFRIRTDETIGDGWLVLSDVITEFVKTHLYESWIEWLEDTHLLEKKRAYLPSVWLG